MSNDQTGGGRPGETRSANPGEASTGLTRAATRGRRDIVEDPDAKYFWPEVDGMLTADFTSDLEKLRDGLPKAGDYRLGFSDDFAAPPGPPDPPGPPGPPIPPGPNERLLPEPEPESLRPEMMTHELRTSRLFDMIDNGGHESNEPAAPADSSPVRGLFADRGEDPRHIVTKGSGALFGDSVGRAQEAPSADYPTMQAPPAAPGRGQPPAPPFGDFANAPTLNGPAATAPSSLARSTMIDHMPSKTPGSSFLDQSTGVLGDVSGPGADQFFGPGGERPGGFVNAGQPIGAFASMSRLDVLRDMMDRRWFSTMLVGSLALVLGVVGWFVLLSGRGDPSDVVADNTGFVTPTTLPSTTATVASPTTISTLGELITTTTVPTTEAPSTTRARRRTTTAPTTTPSSSTTTASTTATTASSSTTTPSSSTTASTTATTASTSTTAPSSTTTTASTTTTTASTTTTTASTATTAASSTTAAG